MNRERLLRTGFAAGAGIALVGAIGTLFASGPYLSVSQGIEAWLVVWGAGIFALLMCAPFAIHDRVSPREGDRDRRWEVAIVVWGGVALVAAASSALLLLFGPGADEALGALALMLLLEAGLVLGAVLVLVLGG